MAVILVGYALAALASAGVVIFFEREMNDGRDETI